MTLSDVNNVASTKSGSYRKGSDPIGLFISVCRFSSAISVSSAIQTGFPNFFRFFYDLISNKAPPLILNSCETQRVLRGMRDKPNVAKITSPWLNIIGIRTRSCVLNSTWDFDLAMCLTRQQRKKLKDVKKQLWIESCFSKLTDEMIHTYCSPSSMVALHYTRRHSRESDYMGF